VIRQTKTPNPKGQQRHTHADWFGIWSLEFSVWRLVFVFLRPALVFLAFGVLAFISGLWNL
jgi:hypothetical protein